MCNARNLSDVENCPLLVGLSPAERARRMEEMGCFDGCAISSGKSGTFRSKSAEAKVAPQDVADEAELLLRQAVGENQRRRRATADL